MRLLRDLGAGADAEVVAEPLLVAGIDLAPTLRTAVLGLSKDFGQAELSPRATQAGPAQFLERDDEVGQVVDPAANEGETELQAVARRVGSASVQGRLDDKGMGGRRILAEHLGVARRGRLEDILVRTLGSDQAAIALAMPDHADGSLEGVTEASPQGGALVLGKHHGLRRLDDESELPDAEIIEHHRGPHKQQCRTFPAGKIRQMRDGLTDPIALSLQSQAMT